MDQGFFKAMREWTDLGFFCDNIEEMIQACQKETDPQKLLAAVFLQSILSGLLKELGDGIVLVSTTRNMEAKYRTAINLILEKAISGASAADQVEVLIDIIRIHRTARG